MAVGQDVRDGKDLHTACLGRLNDSDVRDVVGSQGIKAELHVFRVSRTVVGGKDPMCDGSEASRLPIDTLLGDSGRPAVSHTHQERAGVSTARQPLR